MHVTESDVLYINKIIVVNKTAKPDKYFPKFYEVKHIHTVVDKTIISLVLQIFNNWYDFVGQEMFWCKCNAKFEKWETSPRNFAWKIVIWSCWLESVCTLLATSHGWLLAAGDHWDPQVTRLLDKLCSSFPFITCTLFPFTGSQELYSQVDLVFM